MDSERMSQLVSLRNDLIKLQEKHEEILCTDDSESLTSVEQGFCVLLYNVDHEIRNLNYPEVKNG